jgi:hypothetical protein
LPKTQLSRDNGNLLDECIGLLSPAELAEKTDFAGTRDYFRIDRNPAATYAAWSSKIEV